MKYIPILIQEYIECEQALKEAEKLLDSGSPDANAISRLEMILSADTDAMAMIRMHREYGNRLPVVLEMIAGIRKKYASLWPSEPVSADKPLIVPVTDAEMLSGDWASCVSQAKANNLEIATARQIAELRMKHGRDSDYCTKGGWVAENFNYLPDGNIYIASRDFNPLFLFAEEATKAHAAGKEFFPYGGYLQGIFDAEKQGKALLLKRKDVPDEISVDAFGKEPLTAFIGWNQDYGEFLDSCGIKKIKLYVAEEKYAKKQKQAFSRALWADYLLCNNSALYGYSDYLNFLNYYIGRVSGVRRRGEQPQVRERSEVNLGTAVTKAASSGERSETGSTGPR